MSGLTDKHTPRGATVLVREGQGFVLTHPVFDLVDEKGKKTRFDAVRVLVGAAAGNDLTLDDQTVSAAHFELVATQAGVRIRDLDSTNGTRVGGVRVKEAFLEDGQVIHAGTVALTFKLGKDTVREPVSEKTELFGAVGQSPTMRAVFSRIERAAKTDATVLVTGETGTGKEVTAWAIYEASKRKGKPFVVVDCGAIAKNLIESELFGHEKGAFTGAVARRIGAFERADGGTIFLDEIGELELELQPKLLRVLERREIQRLGGEKTIPVDVRIIAATNRDLRAMVARGAFREDLYYRLAVVALELPPLRERREDLPLLVERFVRDMGATMNDLPAGALDRFMEHAWPGNCRELKNAVERAVVLGETRFLSSSPRTDEGRPVLGPEVATEDQPPHFHIDLSRPYKDQKADVVAAFEEAYVRALMAEHHGNVSAAARQAGIDRMSLHKILTRYGLDAKELASST